MSDYEVWVRQQISEYKATHTHVDDPERGPLESQTRLATQVLRKMFRQVWVDNNNAPPAPPAPQQPLIADAELFAVKSHHMCADNSIYSELVTKYKRLARNNAPTKTPSKADPVKAVLGRDGNQWHPVIFQVINSGDVESTAVWVSLKK